MSKCPVFAARRTRPNSRIEDADPLGGPNKRVGLDTDLPLEINRQLPGELAIRQLPYDYPGNFSDAHSHAVEWLLLPASLTQQLRTATDEVSSSLYATFIAGAAVLLQR